MLDVVEIVAHALAHHLWITSFAAIPIDLRPAGYSGFDALTTRILLDDLAIVFVVSERMRPRPYDRQLSAKHIEELRKFVEAGTPEKPSNSRNTYIVTLRLHDHGAVLEHRHCSVFDYANDPAPIAATRLDKEYRS